MVVAPIAALVALGDDPGATPFVSNRLAEPHYGVMLAWNPDSMPGDWEAGRRRNLELTWIRALTTWGAFALFLAALVVELD